LRRESAVIEKAAACAVSPHRRHTASAVAGALADRLKAHARASVDGKAERTRRVGGTVAGRGRHDCGAAVGTNAAMRSDIARSDIAVFPFGQAVPIRIRIARYPQEIANSASR